MTSVPSPLDLVDLPFLRTATIEVLLLAVAGGLLGAWIVLRRLAFFAHAVGGATFPGLVVADATGVRPIAAALAGGLAHAGGGPRAGARAGGPGGAGGGARVRGRRPARRRARGRPRGRCSHRHPARRRPGARRDPRER